MTDLGQAEWIALDWGTSNLRGWAMRGGNVLVRNATAEGVGRLEGDGFGAALSRLIDGWPVASETPAVACGMIGARQGWAEAPYHAVPCRPLTGGFAQVAGLSRPVHVIPGLRQDTPPDVMRGEETQIAGFLALNPGWDGVVCLPGTHTKWVQLSAGEVVSFQTFMTGELFELLATGSILRHSVTSEDWEAAAFDGAVSDAMSRPERMAAALFGIRAGDLLNAAPPAQSRARLSGLLIGAELAAARPYWLGQNIAVLGADGPASLYAVALEAQGVLVTVADAERMTLAGLTAAYRLIKETT